MDAFGTLREIVNRLDGVPDAPADPPYDYKNARIRMDIYDRIMVWKEEWGEKTLSDTLQRILDLARMQLQTSIEFLDEVERRQDPDI